MQGNTLNCLNYVRELKELGIGIIFEKENIKDALGWQYEMAGENVQCMLEKEKYKDDAVLQKSYTVDFLTKKRMMNQVELQKFYIEDDHEAIIEPWIWECV